MRRRLVLLAVGIAGMIGFAVAPHANAEGGVCLNAHVEVNGEALVDQHPCVPIPDAPPAPTPPTVPGLPPRVSLGPVEVDVAGHRVLRDGREVPLKPKVFELLAFLLRHPGQVVSRDLLLERVWGYDYPGETRTVDVHVHWLRSAIEPEPSNPTIIQTVRGVGYVLRRPEPVAA